MLHALQGPLADSPPSAVAAQHAAVYLRAQGYTVPNWEEAMRPFSDAPSREEPYDHLRGWQRRAAHACDERAFETFFSSPSPASRALLLSQAGPHSSRAFTVLPTHEDVTLPGAHFRVPLLRRLRLPLPLAPRACACRRPLDVLGDHPAACATAGVLASRTIPLERALARVCREAGARVARNVRLADMNLDVPVQDARRIEVVCNGLPLWHGEQLAVDSSVPSAGMASPGPTWMPIPASLLPRPPAANNAKPTLSSSGHAAATWLCSGSR